MSDENTHESERHPLNAEGPFYIVCGPCMSCLMTERDAPDVIGFDADEPHCYIARQPETDDEFTQVLDAFAVAYCQGLRYGGEDTRILKRMKALGLGAQCDALAPAGPPLTAAWTHKKQFGG